MQPQDLSFLDAIPELDWARLAAYIDGEGCMRIAGVKGKQAWSRRVLYAELNITNTDVRLIEWLKTRFGGSVWVDNRRRPEVIAQKHALAYRWTVGSRHAATLVERCLPYFLLKREQAEILLAFQRTIIVDRRYGRKGRPAELLVEQHKLREQLSALKGRNARTKRTMVTDSIQ